MRGSRFHAGALLALLLTLPPLASAATEQRYSALFQGQPGGQMVTRVDADGRVSVDYSYRDNGRGPDLKESFAVDAAGVPVSYQGNGTSTFGGAINERFSLAAGTLEWEALVDRGRQPVPATTLYLPIEASPEYMAQLVRALQRQPEGRAPTLGGGQFSVERLARHTLGGAQAPLEVGLYALTGIGFAPQYLWLREDGSQALFAEVDAGWALIEQGFEADAKALLARQQQARAERGQVLRERLAKPLPGLTVIRNVRWFDTRAAVMRGPSDVLLFAGRISAINPVGSTPQDVAQSIDGSGRTLLPGLFDMHAHIGPDDLLLHLAGGVTSVRDVGNDNEDLARIKARVDAGQWAGPRITANGFIEGRSAFSSMGGIVVDDLDAAKRAVDWYAERGYGQLKLYNSFKPEWVKPITAYAHAKGLRVGGHIPAFMRAEQAVAAGYDEVHHINQLFLNFLVDADTDTRTLQRFYLVAEKAQAIDLDGPRVKSFLKLLRQRGTVIDPTVGIFDTMFRQRNGEPNPSYASVADHLPLAVQRSLRSAEMDVNADNAARYKASYETLLSFVGRLFQAGVPLVAGTDDVPGFTLHHELLQYVKAGIPPAQVLKIATFNGARYTRTAHETGSIEPGKRADLLLIDGDPSQQIEDIRKASLVIQGSVAYEPAAIYEAVGVRPFAAGAAIVAGNSKAAR